MARTIDAVAHAARRDLILDAAQRLIVSKGYARLTVQDILDELRLSKGAFYHYFGSKLSVIEALIQRLIRQSVQALEPVVADRELGALEKLQRFLGETIQWKSARRNLFVAMLPVWYGSSPGTWCTTSSCDSSS